MFVLSLTMYLCYGSSLLCTHIIICVWMRGYRYSWQALNTSESVTLHFDFSKIKLKKMQAILLFSRKKKIHRLTAAFQKNTISTPPYSPSCACVLESAATLRSLPLSTFRLSLMAFPSSTARGKGCVFGSPSLENRRGF